MEAKSSTNPKIEHVVLLMLENRSMDHMCGFLKKINSNIDGLNGNERCYYNPAQPNLGSVQVTNNSGYITPIDPNHSTHATTEQIFGYKPPHSSDPAPMDGFIYNYLQTGDTADKGAKIMECFDPKNVPAISTLATEFAIFDHWFAAIPGPTQPNRLFMHSATSWGASDNDTDQLIEGYPQRTIYDNLSQAGYSWCDYFSDVPSALFLRRLREPQYWDCFADMGQFYDDAAAGNLPTYSFLEPRWFALFDMGASDEHPPHDVRLGEYLIADIYEALRNGPKWNSTLFIITYDEHGGFYDHVSPPQKNVPAPDDHRPPTGQPPFNFDRLGVRVPCIMVSPWINKNTVIHEPPGNTDTHFTHTSILATVKKWFDLPSFLTLRDAWSPTFEGIVQARASPRTDCPTTIPRPGSLEDQQKWSEYSKTRLTSEFLEECIKREETGSTAPISHLQEDILAIAMGLSPEADSEPGALKRALIHAQQTSITTEHQGALFVIRQTLNFLKRVKKEHEKKKQEEWVVL